MRYNCIHVFKFVRVLLMGFDMLLVLNSLSLGLRRGYSSFARLLNYDIMSIYAAAGTGKSTCVHPVKEPIIDDGSTGGVLQQKEDEGMLLIFVCVEDYLDLLGLCVFREKKVLLFF